MKYSYFYSIYILLIAYVRKYEKCSMLIKFRLLRPQRTLNFQGYGTVKPKAVRSALVTLLSKPIN
jgi:hypothetical protein